MTKQEAEAYIQNSGAEQGTGPTRDSTSTQTASQTSQSSTGSSDSSESPESQGSEETGETRATSDSQSSGDRKWTRAERTRHAFKVEKQKRQRAQQELQNKEMELQKLREQIESLKGRNRESFESEDQWQDYKIDMKLADMDLKGRERELESSRERARAEDLREARETNLRRVSSNFPDKTEREQYLKILSEAERSFGARHPELGCSRFSEFLASEKDLTVLKYLEDSDSSPRLMKHFIMKPEAALKIMNLKNPLNKLLELRALERRMNTWYNLKSKKAQKQLPNTGKLSTQNQSQKPADYSRKWTKRDAERWLKQHK